MKIDKVYAFGAVCLVVGLAIVGFVLLAYNGSEEIPLTEEELALYKSLPDEFLENGSIVIDDSGGGHRVVTKPSVLERIGDWFASPFAEGDWAKEDINDMLWSGLQTSIANDSSGNLHICYPANVGGSPRLGYGFYNGTWNLEIINQTGCNEGYYCSIAVNSTDDVYISEYYYCSGGLQDLVVVTGKIWEWWLNETIDNAADVGKYTSIAINSTDDALISYYDVTNAALKGAYGSYGHWTVETIDNAADVGKYTSIAINSTDDATIMYIDNTNTNIKAAHGTYSHWVLETVFNSPLTPKYTSIAINSTDGIHAIFAKRNANNTDSLEYLTGNYGHWKYKEIDYIGGTIYQGLSIGYYLGNLSISGENAAGGDLLYYNGTVNSISDWDIRSAVDTAGTVGAYSSIKTVNGTVHIIYFDDTNNKIKHAWQDLFLPYGGGGGAGGCGNQTNVSFDNPSVSGELSTFNITLNYSQVDNTNANVTFNYNGTTHYPVIIENYGNISVWSLNLTAPTVTSTTTVPIWWNATNIDSFLCSGVKYHTISIIEITECDGDDEILILNVTHWEENNVTISANVSMDINFDIREIDGVDSELNFSFESYPQIYHPYCVSANLSDWITADVEMFYFDEAGTYDAKTHYLINTNFSTLENATTTTPTYSLYSYLSQVFQLTAWDELINNLDGYIQINKFYVGEYLYRTVETVRTDDEGEAVAHFELNDPYYQFVIMDSDGTALYTTDKARMYCTVLPCTYLLIAKEGTTGLIPYEGSDSISYNLSWDEYENNYFSFQFVDSSGETSQGYLEVVHRNASGDTLVYNGSINASSGTLLFNATDDCGDVDCTMLATGYLVAGGVRTLIWQTVGEILYAVEVFGMEGAFWAMIILVTTVLVGAWNPAAAFFLMAMALIMVVNIGIVAIPWAAISAVIAIIVILLWRTRS